MCKDRNKVTAANIIGLIFAFIAVAAAIAALIINQITTFLDSDDDPLVYCGWQGVSCDDSLSNAECSLFEFDYNDFCDAGAQNACDTEAAGEGWLYAAIAGIVLCVINFILVVVQWKRVGSIFGCVGCLAFIAALLIWVGLDDDFDFEGNTLCYDSDDLEDGDITPGTSMYLMMGAAVCSFVGSILSCAS